MTSQKWLPFNILKDDKQNKKGELGIFQKRNPPKYMESIFVYGNNSKTDLDFLTGDILVFGGSVFLSGLIQMAQESCFIPDSSCRGIIILSFVAS